MKEFCTGDLIVLRNTSRNRTGFYSTEVLSEEGFVMTRTAYAKSPDNPTIYHYYQVYFPAVNKVQLCYFLDIELKTEGALFRMKHKV